MKLAALLASHLFLGAAIDNIRDMVAKGRGRYGPFAPSRVSA